MKLQVRIGRVLLDAVATPADATVPRREELERDLARLLVPVRLDEVGRHGAPGPDRGAIVVEGRKFRRTLAGDVAHAIEVGLGRTRPREGNGR